MRKTFLAVFFMLLSSCYLQRYPVTYDVADQGVYKVITEYGSASAWAVSDYHLVTAGHVCNHTRDLAVSSYSGRKFPVDVVEWEYDDGNQKDLCLLKSHIKLPRPLVIADQMPVVGEAVKYIGYPLGNYLRSEGKYVGDVDGPDSDENDYVFSARCDRGASGSAVFTERGVFGVLVRLRTDGPRKETPSGEEGCVVIPLWTLRDFLDASGVKYTLTPDDPDSVKLPRFM